MGADNWRRCPRCWDETKREYSSDLDAVLQTYGKVPVEDFDAARAALKDPEQNPFEATFREDYEFYCETDGKLRIIYAGSCKVCGLRVELAAEKMFWPRQTSLVVTEDSVLT